MYQLKSDDSADLNNQLREHIVAFNAAHFNAERIPLGFKFVNKQNSVVAGIHGQVFGNWLLISWLWTAKGYPSFVGNGTVSGVCDDQ